MIEYGTHRHPTAVANEAQLFFGGGDGWETGKRNGLERRKTDVIQMKVKENVKESRKSQERESAVYYDCSGVVKAHSRFSGQFY